jgi:hypothetical protein
LNKILKDVYENCKTMFENLYNQVKVMPNSFDKLVVMKNYIEFLIEDDKNSLLAYSIFYILY